MTSPHTIPWDRLEQLLGHDPARRGLGAYHAAHGPLSAGQLQAAAQSLAHEARGVAIVTGFCVADAAKPAGETDGPPGAIYLARALCELGLEVSIVSDSYSLPLLECGCDHAGLPRRMLLEFPFEPGGPEAIARRSHAPAYNQQTDAWIDSFLTRGPGRRLTHLIAIERVGPSHTPESLAAQVRSGAAPIDAFLQDVPPESRDVCHNMRGLPISGYTAKTHRLFETIAERRLPIRTVGLGDGGNELGLGSIPWEKLRAAIAFGPGGRIACRTAATDTILAGVSNWAAYALAAAVCCLRQRGDLLTPWNCDLQRALITALVRDTDAVDGATRLRQATVDGLPLETYLQGLAGVRRVLGFEA